MSLGENIRNRRQAIGLSQRELADRSPTFDSNAVSRWEREVNVPSIASLQDLATALETTPDDLAGYSLSLAGRVAELEKRLAALERRS